MKAAFDSFIHRLNTAKDRNHDRSVQTIQTKTKTEDFKKEKIYMKSWLYTLNLYGVTMSTIS